MSILDIAKSAATGSPVDIVASVVDASLKNTNDAKAEAAFRELVEDSFFELRKEWEDEKHKGKQPPSLGDVVQGLLRFREAYHGAGNNKKRRMLYTAFWSAFRPEFYDAGLSDILWGKVEDLEYPDLVFLAKVIENTKPEERLTQYFESAYEGGRGKWRGDQMPIYESSEDAECADRLSHRGLVSVEASDTHGVLLVSWRGVARKLKDFALQELWNEQTSEESGSEGQIPK